MPNDVCTASQRASPLSLSHAAVICFLVADILDNDDCAGPTAVLAPPGALGNIMKVLPIKCTTEDSDPVADQHSPQVMLKCACTECT